MGRIRTVKPEFFASESVAELPIRARLTWIGLWTHCDDHGRAKANPRLIKAAVWPLDNVSLRDVEKDLDDLEAMRLIVRYQVAGKNYLAVTNWDEHQAAAYRRGGPKHPAPPAPIAPAEHGVQESASRTTEDASRTTANPEYSTTESPADDVSPGQTGDSKFARQDVQESASHTQKSAYTGNREQGTGNRGAATRGDVVAATDPPPTTQTLLAEWLDHCAEPPPSRVKGHVAKEIKTMVDEGISAERIRAGLAEWNAKGLSPATLPSVVHGIGNTKPPPNGRQQSVDGIYQRAMQRATSGEQP